MEAIDSFNKAILLAPTNKEGKGRDLSLAVANRSAALMRLGYHEAALKDVELSLESGYPSDLKYKILERKIRLMGILEIMDGLDGVKKEFVSSIADSKLPKEKRKKFINQKISVDDAPDSLIIDDNLLSHKIEQTQTHHLLPSLSNMIDIKYEKKRGRFAVANR